MPPESRLFSWLQQKGFLGDCPLTVSFFVFLCLGLSLGRVAGFSGERAGHADRGLQRPVHCGGGELRSAD